MAIKILESRLLRYLFTGGITFTAEYALFFILETSTDINLGLAHSISFCAGVLISFTLNRRWTFRSVGYKKRIHHQMSQYAMLALFNLGITNLVISRLVHWGVNPLTSKLVVMSMIVVWNFLIFRQVIFKSKTILNL